MKTHHFAARQRKSSAVGLLLIVASMLGVSKSPAAPAATQPAAAEYKIQTIEGWTVHINTTLFTDHPAKPRLPLKC